jgi:hypothetical protein
MRLAMQKFASNAIELLLEACASDDRHRLTAELFEPRKSFIALLKNVYGNYVIQKCLDLLHGKELDDLLEKFPPILANDQEGQIRRVRSRLFRKFPHLHQETNELTGVSKSEGKHYHKRSHKSHNHSQQERWRGHHGVWRTFSKETNHAHRINSAAVENTA